jgi:hypothetical protein
VLVAEDPARRAGFAYLQIKAVATTNDLPEIDAPLNEGNTR